MVDIVRPVYGEAWASSGEKLSPTEIKVQSGWVQEMMPYQWENFLQNRQDTTLLYLLQKGVPEWSADQEYIGNKSIVTYNGYTYQAKSTNTGNLPTDSVYWKRTSPNVTDVGVVTLGSGGTGATNATDARANLGLGTAATVSADTIVFKSVTGNAPAADKWTSPISLSLSGGATGNTSLDGSGNATINVSGLNASSISSGTVPSSALTNATLKTSSTGSTILAAGFTSERDLVPQEGYGRWNKTTKVFELFNGTAWVLSTSQSEEYLLNRANHTGTQAIATVIGLQSTLDSKLSLSGGTLSGNLTVPSLNGGQLAGMRNKLINGNFAVNQRAVSGTVTLAAGAYGHDRWKAGASGCTYTFSTVQNVTTITITSGSLVQVIEGLNLQSGTHVLSWQGTAQGRVDAGAYGTSGAVTGTAIGGTNQIVEFNAGTVSLVQYEPGTVATPFEHRFYGAELALCQRYYQDYSNIFALVSSLAATYANQKILPVAMRAAPTVTQSTPTGSGAAWGGSPSVVFQNGIHSADSVTAILKLSAEL